MDAGVISQLADAGLAGYASAYHHHGHGWPTIAFQQPSPLSVHYPYGGQHAPPSRGWCKPEQQDAAAAHSLQDLQQLHLGHNFFGQGSSSSTVYNGGGYHQGGLGGGGGATSFLMAPSSTIVAADQGHSSTANQGSTCSYGGGGGDEEGKLIGYDAAAMAVGDPYAAARTNGGYQFSQGSAASTVSIARANGYSANNWSSPFNGMG
ncbi:hypothetical protein EJB05_20789, partial [Eragrostis curvula]